MGRNFITRPRMQSIPPGVLSPIMCASLAETDINYENYDFQQIADVINGNLDTAQANLTAQQQAAESENEQD